MRIQSSHSLSDRGLDPYFTPPEATWSLLSIEPTIPNYCIWEPAAGNGAISEVLRIANCSVYATDIADYGNPKVHHGFDFFTTTATAYDAIITNPPFKLALQFAEKALNEVEYLALLLRTNFLESTNRLPFFRQHPPARIHISSRRLPMMHREGWNGPEAPSNTCFAWFIWDSQSSPSQTILHWFDWAELQPAPSPIDPAELGL